MKLIFLFLSISVTSLAQSPCGDWYATLKAADLQLVFHITKDKKNHKVTIDSPKQKAFDIPAEISLLKNNRLKVEMKNIGFIFEGVYYADSIAGVFQQGANVEKMTFYKDAKQNNKPKRPQNPKPPFSYDIEEVKFMNLQDSFHLAGTLTLPKNNNRTPAIVLISGSGPQNRDSEIMGHKPFWVLSDYLTSLGYAVLRYDDRGTYASEGDFASATTLDFALDGESAIEYLKGREDIDSNKIVVIGHSEGGLICNILGARVNNLSGIVSLAGTSIRGDSILQIQSRLISESNNTSEQELEITQKYNREIFKAVVTSLSISQAKIELEKISKRWTKVMCKNDIIKRKERKEVIKSVSQTMLNPWMYEFVKYSPSEDIKNLHCHVLVLIGSNDIQVTSKENIEGYKKLLPKNRKLQTVKELPGLNHLFQKCSLCTISEYGQLEETFSMDAMEEIRDFLQEIWN